MQAHRLRAADAPYHAQVVKALVDHTTHSAAFLLADSSCLLFSLAAAASPASSCTLHIPSPCTDACFLRLQARVPAGTSSPIPSPPRHPLLHRNGAKTSASLGEPLVLNGDLACSSRLGLHQMIQDAQLGDTTSAEDCSTRALTNRNQAETAGVHLRSEKAETSIGTGSAGAHKSAVFLLVACPGKGGLRTDLMAWHCRPHLFCRVPTSIYTGRPEVETGSLDVGMSSASRRVASLDVPHGMTVKLAATVNVVALYSVAAGKVWIMSAKAMEGGCNVSSRLGQDFCPHSNDWSASFATSRKCLNADVYESESRGVSKASELGTKDGLQLMMCAVLDCNKPVFSLHLSPQHLLLGESGGIRVFHLRSLVKPRRRLGKLQGSIFLNDQSYLCEHTRSNCTGVVLDHIGFVKGVINGRESPKFDERDEDQRDNVAAREKKNSEGLLDPAGKASDKLPTDTQVAVMAGSMNGTHAHTVFFERARIPYDARIVPTTGCATGGEGRIGYAPKELGSQGSIAYVLDNFLFKENVEVVGELENEDEKRIGGIMSSSSTGAHSTSSVTTMSNRVISVQTSRRAVGDSLLVPRKMNDWRRNGTISQRGQEVVHAYYQPKNPFCPIMTHMMPLPARTLVGKESLQGSGQGAPVFVGLADFANGEGASSVMNHATCVQVVDIQCLGAKKFLVLDSLGKLHLMTLQNSWFLCHNADDHERRTKVLKTSLKVLSLTVLPLPSQGSGSPASRTVWLTDGSCSIHIVSVPREGGMEEDGVESGAVLDGFPDLSVMRAVYTKDPVTALLASSSNSVMVVSPGSMVTYVMMGA